ncbi:hypothetical protein GMMP15_830015 [Candidatus Magnetomoraceae bacterium gMMP-15]
MNYKFIIFGITLFFLAFISSYAFAITLSPNSEFLGWDTASDNIIGYRIYYGKKSGEYTYSKELGNVLEYPMSKLNLEDDTTYYFVIKAYNSETESEPSEELSWTTGNYTSPITPQGVVLENIGEDSLKIQWGANSDKDLLYYNIYYGMSSGVYGNPIRIEGNTTEHTLKLENGKTYYFIVTAVDDAGNESDPSIEASKQVSNPDMSETPVDDSDDSTDTLATHIYWNCSEDKLQVYNASDGMTVTRDEATYATGKEDNGISTQSGNIKFKATHGNNINLDKGVISFWFKKVSNPHSYGMFFSLGSDYHDFTFYRYQDYETFTFYYTAANGSHSRVFFRGTPDVFDGNWHHMKLVWDNSVPHAKLYIDEIQTGGTQTIATGRPSPSGDNMYLGNNSTKNFPINGIIDEFYISSDSSSTEPPSTIEPPSTQNYVYWNCSEDKLQVYNASDGMTVTRDEATYATGKEDNGISTQSGNIKFKATHGNNINLDKGVISFWFKKVSNPHSYGMFFSLGSDYHDFTFYRYQDYETFTFYYTAANGSHSRVFFRGTPDVFDGSWHHMKLVWDNSVPHAKLYIDAIQTGGTQTIAAGRPSPSDDNMYLGNNSGKNFPINGIIDEFYILSDTD